MFFKRKPTLESQLEKMDLQRFFSKETKKARDLYMVLLYNKAEKQKLDAMLDREIKYDQEQSTLLDELASAAPSDWLPMRIQNINNQLPLGQNITLP